MKRSASEQRRNTSTTPTSVCLVRLLSCSASHQWMTGLRNCKRGRKCRTWALNTEISYLIARTTRTQAWVLRLYIRVQSWKGLIQRASCFCIRKHKVSSHQIKRSQLSFFSSFFSTETTAQRSRVEVSSFRHRLKECLASFSTDV